LSINTSEIFHAIASSRKDQIAVIDREKRYTYGELSVQIKHVAGKLISMGVRAGSCIGVIGQNSSEFIIMAYAVMDCQAVFFPISPTLSPVEINDSISKISADFLIIENQQNSIIAGSILSKKEKIFDGWCLQKVEKLQNSVSPAILVPNAAFIRFTSGTTGVSKGVVLSHETIEERILCANSSLQISEHDHVLCVLSMAFHFVVSVILYLRNGACLILCHEINAQALLQCINDFKVTFIYASPLHIRLLAGDSGNNDISTVRMVVSTSSSIEKDVCQRFKERYSISITQAYGIIELGLPVVNINDSDISPELIGTCSKGFQAKIFDETLQALPFGETGQLGLSGPGMLDAYLSPFKRRADILHESWFLTGDLASMDELGRIKIQGRKKSMINVGGNKLFPEEVESVLLSHPSIANCRVKGIEHSLLGEVVGADIVLKENCNVPDHEELRSLCRKQLSAYKIPHVFSFIDHIPSTPSGKNKR
jgi:acyl-coenzyme A synthetase/AMP-(fatty) acid ligase